MIHVRFNIDQNHEIVGFNVNHHGDKVICAAVSALVINTINSIEQLTGADYYCEYENEQFINFRLTDKPNSDIRLLLNSLRLGIRSITQEHPDEVAIEEILVTYLCKRGAL